MTEEERRYKIKKIEKYNELIKEENSNIIKSTFLTGLSAAACVAVASNPTNKEQITLVLATLVSGGNFSFWLSVMISCICKKTNYNAEKIKEQFDLNYDYEQNKSRGGR